MINWCSEFKESKTS